MKQHYHPESKNQKPRGKKNMKKASLGPSQQTLLLLMQFARAYHVEPELQKPFCGFILN